MEKKDRSSYILFVSAMLIYGTIGVFRKFIPLSSAALADFRYYLIGIAAVGLLLSAAFITYLCFAAGKSSKLAGVKPGGLNRLPLDLYGVGLGVIALFLYLCLKEVVEELVFYDAAFVVLHCILASSIMLVGALCVLAGVFALGNVLTEELTSILRSPRARAMVEGFSCRRPSEELCRRCGYAQRFSAKK